MLIAHLVPGYFIAVNSQKQWDDTWTVTQRRILWTVAFSGTFLADTDVIVNIFFHGIFNHSTLLTHSLFPVLMFTLTWLFCKYILQRPYLSTIFSLLAMSWLSHLFLDALVHKTPLLYPLSSVMIGYAPPRVYAGGFWYYLTDPIFLLEPLLISIGIGHWLYHRIDSPKSRQLMLAGLLGLYIIVASGFLFALPYLQEQLPPL